MNEKEKKEFYIATCKCCLLAEGMKTCSSCRFNIGLVEKALKLTEFIPLPSPTRIELFAMTEDC